MTNWRNHILKEFTPQVVHLTLVADPDGLLLEEGMMQAIQERGFDLLPFDDPVAFRFAYESMYRSHWDVGQRTELVVVLRSTTHELDTLPFDLLQVGRRLSFNLGDLFPNLSYPVIAALDRGDLDALYQAQERHSPEPMGDNGTKDFVMRHVFQVASELIRQPSDLLRVLLRRHHQGQHLPRLLDDRLIHLLRQRPQFEDWPLETIVQDREAFFAFLQERWPRFVLKWLTANPEFQGLGLQNGAAEIELPSVPDLPFDHDDVRVYIDNLFLEGFLKPLDVFGVSGVSQSEKLLSNWASVGLRLDAVADRARRVTGLIKSLREQLPGTDARYQAWLAYGQRWAELIALWPELNPSAQSGQITEFQSLREIVDDAFLAWVGKRYGGLHNLPASPPVMLHHIPRYLAREIDASRMRKAALIVVDGLALDQWVVVRETLARQEPDMQLREGAIFAWLPTITSVSRQAAFAGKAPIFFPSSIHTTDKEPMLWTQFWADHGLTRHETGYLKGLGDEASWGHVENLLSDPQIRAAGLVIDKVDRIMHGMEMGTAGMHNQVRQWAEGGFLSKLLSRLLECGFGVIVTSDHGNIEAEGGGRPSEGAIADVRGERVRVYPDDSLRSVVKEQYPSAIEWSAVGLPENYLPLLAAGRSAFITKSKRLVCHGGISIEELIVPLVQIGHKTL